MLCLQTRPTAPVDRVAAVRLPCLVLLTLPRALALAACHPRAAPRATPATDVQVISGNGTSITRFKHYGGSRLQTHLLAVDCQMNIQMQERASWEVPCKQPLCLYMVIFFVFIKNMYLSGMIID